MKKIKSAFKIILFLIIFSVIFSYLSELFSRKALEGTWNNTQKTAGFYNAQKNEFDIIFFGSSNTYCSFNPLVLYDESGGVKSYVFATQQQPVWASYAYMKDALKTQTPKLMVLDVLMFSQSEEYYDDGVNYSFMDDMPFSKNKVELAFASAPPKEALMLLINFIKYHSRWSELTQEDYTFKRSEAFDYLRGYTLLEETASDALPPDGATDESAPLGKKQALYLDKIIKLAKRENIPMLFVKAPSNERLSEQKYYNEAEKICKENNIDFIDYNRLYDDIGLVMTEDFYDKSHLNYKGAEKFTRYFWHDIKNRYSIVPGEKSDDWQKDFEKYKSYISQIT